MPATLILAATLSLGLTTAPAPAPAPVASGTVSAPVLPPALTVRLLPGSRAVFTLPTGYHFNTKLAAELHARTAASPDTPVSPASVTEREVQAALPRDLAGLTAAFMVCDDANTVCMRVKRTYVLDSGLLTEHAPEPPPGPSISPGGGSAGSDPGSGIPGPTDHLGFLVNEPGKALEVARRENRPLLIDFFGIWCPPCNMLDAVVFGTPAFRKATTRFVKLKLDADRATSWPLKEKYQVGGYPTVILADPAGKELSRIVGFRSAQEFVALVDRVKDRLSPARTRGDPREDRLAEARRLLERKELDSAVELLEDLHADSPRWFKGDRQLLLHEARIAWAQEAWKDGGEPGIPERLKAVARKHLMACLQEGIRGFPRRAEALDWTRSLAGLTGETGDADGAARLWRAGEELVRFLERDTKERDRAGYSVADLEAAHASIREGQKDEAGAREAYTRAARAYEEEMRRQGLDPSRDRGFNLERAYCLRRAGKTAEARALYGSLERLYPGEFTFYFAHAALLREHKELKAAEEAARKGLEHSYGDNRLRSAEQLARILQEAGRRDEAVKVLGSAVAEARLPADPNSRTHRYHRALLKLLEKLRKDVVAVPPPAGAR